MSEQFDDEQLEQFRKEYQDLEKDIGTYIGLYLSALVVATGYIIGKDARSLHDMVAGNNGYNFYAVLILGWGNLAFCSALAYKQIFIQELTQFIFKNAKSPSIYEEWEKWRRSENSVTRPARLINFVLVLSIPIIVHAALLLSLGRVLFKIGLTAPISIPPVIFSPCVWFSFLLVASLTSASFFGWQSVFTVASKWVQLNNERVNDSTLKKSK
jgi:hypothetical protein